MDLLQLDFDWMWFTFQLPLIVTSVERRRLCFYPDVFPSLSVGNIREKRRILFFENFRMDQQTIS